MEKNEKNLNNESGASEESLGYADMLAQAKNDFEDKIRKMKAEHQAEMKKMTELVYSGAGNQPAEPENVEVVPTRLELYKKYKTDKNMTNLEFWKNQLDLREATIREYGRDPWVSGSYGQPAPGSNPQYSESEEEAMKKMAETIKGIIEQSEGDPARFNYLFQSAVRL